jgi:DNA (cytosine-5)-methyltransferase 1
MFTYGDLFSGMSCPAFALKQLGAEFEYKFACDLEATCRKFVKDHHQPEVIHGDICKITELPHVDLLVAGFCCQPFSSLQNTVATKDHVSVDLSVEAVRCIGLSKPKMFILENVKAFTFKNNKVYFDRMIDLLKPLGYKVEWKVLNSLDHGTPQSRPRFWLIGKKDGEIHWPIPKGLKYNLKEVIDATTPLTVPFVTKNKYKHEESMDRPDTWYINNGQSVGMMAKYFPLSEKGHAQCVVAGNPTHVFYIDGDLKPFRRALSNKELKMLFGCTSEIKEWVSNSSLAKLFGNGMDIHMLEQLIYLNCDYEYTYVFEGEEIFPE